MNVKRYCAFPTVLLKRVLQSACLIILTVALTACASDPADGDPDEGGIIGTGILLRGGVDSPVLANSGDVEVKSFDGQRSRIVLNAKNQYDTTALNGKGPWVLRAGVGSDAYVYGIAYTDGTRNINRFSDLALRAWFAQDSLTLDEQFALSEPFNRLPSAIEYDAVVDRVFALIEPVLISYNVSGQDAISADYQPNDQGIDRFLNHNSVLIENGLVAFLLTDPTTETQSITRSSLSLGGEFLDGGAQAPTTPSGVKALGISSDEIVLVWDHAVDDVAVLEYRVIRDGELISTSPYPVFVDNALIQTQSYEYEIVAVDTAGNESSPSQTATASPMQFTEAVVPSAPSFLLELATSDSTIKLLWAQDSIGSVVRFNVYRALESQTPAFTFSVTSTVATDLNVVENETYCYQVTAIGATGLESPRSEILCATAGGEPNSTPNQPSFNWVLPNINALNCDQTFSNEQLVQTLTVLEGGCYSVPETISINPGTTLRLVDGVVLKFGDAAKLLVPKNATLTINGTLNKPVVLTGDVGIPGYWGGVEFQGSRSAGNLIRGSVIQYAGNSNTNAAVSVTTSGSRFRVEDTLIQFNQEAAFNFVFRDIVVDAFDGNLISDNKWIGAMTLEVMQSLVGNSEYRDNERNEIGVPRNSYTGRQISVPNLGPPLSWSGIVMRQGSLSIGPGVEIRLFPNSVIDVEGTFSINGTSEEPVVLTGKTLSQGSWEGLRLSGRGDKTIDHVNISYAGADRADTGAIAVACTADSDTKVTINNADISQSASFGIYIDGEGCNTEVGKNVTYFNNALGDINLP